MVAHASQDMQIEHFDINSMYPAICLQNNFIVGPGIRLIGPQMVSRLRLDYDRGCFVY